MDMSELLKQAQAVQEKMTKMQDDLGAKTVEGSSGGGMVRVVCSGKQEVRSITIEKTVVNADDVEMLQDLVVAAVNDALKASKSLMESEMATLTGGLKFPGM